MSTIHWTDYNKKIILLLCSVGMIILALYPNTLIAQSSLPSEYLPNHQIADEYDELLDYFIEIEAAARVGTELDQQLFRDINAIFRKVFTYFPKSSSNEVVYRQCILISDDLASGYTRAKYNTFRNRCFESLGGIIREINNRHTVVAKITANPRRGSSPLNVTFDARESTDPSNDTIPSSNFYRWYKDVFGVDQAIGRGPVVNYTFDQPGNHVVHLTVRSSNNLTQGVFDGRESIQINVAPKAANMVVYVNGQQTSETRAVKIGSQDAERGILIDGTATVPLGARTIVSHKRTIRGSSDMRFEDISTGEGSPGQFLFVFPQNGIYTIELEIIDNEGNRIIERYNVSVSDPVATIRFKPDRGNTSTEFTFDAGASYSITSRIRSYQWTIIDPTGRQIESIQARELKRKFTIPGTYTINLTTTDEQGNSSLDSQQIFIGSTPPIPAFVVQPESERKHPSQFVLDATGTFDEDVRAGHDTLTYSWTFSNNNNVLINEIIEENESKIRVSMEQPGTYRVKLIVEDSYGERREVEREIIVESSLRPNILITPQVGVWGEEITLLARVNKPVAFYQRNFGDGKSQQTREPRVTYSYEESGLYTVTLQVITQDGEENEVKQSVFMGQKDMPVPAYSIKSSGNTELRTTTTCTDLQGNTHEAYQIERYQNIAIDAIKSTNAQGNNNNIRISFHPRNDQVYNTSVLSYGFPELGCTHVDLFVQDDTIGKTEKATIRFDIINALPTLQNLTLTFPQAGGGNPVGVGGNPTSLEQETNIFANSSIIVRLQARGARDPDGFISHFRRYYYPSNDPLRREGFKITPGDVPYTTFVIPKPIYATEYAFAVEMIDNDDGRVSSEDVVGKGPIIFFPPDEDNLDIPIVTLTASRVTARVGDEISFTTTASVLSDNPDFESTRYFKYDFDGDGIYDIPSTRNNVVTHTFTKPGTYKPKVSVFFRGRAGVGTTDTITILRGLKPNYEVSTFGNQALVRDFSDGDITELSFCMDINVCNLQSGSGTIANESVFLYEYPGPGRYLSRLDVVDEYSNEQRAQKFIDIEEATDTFGILSVPAATKNADGSFTIPVSQSLLDINLYPVWKGSGNCFIDVDITSDSNGDGDPTRDQDIACNELSTISLFPKNKEQVGTIYYVDGGSIKETTITFDFFDYEPPLDDEWDRAREKINELITAVDGNDAAPQGIRYYKELLINLREVLGETFEMNSVIAQLLDYIGQNRLLLNDQQEGELRTLLAALASNEVKEVFGATTYELAKSEILARFSDDHRRTIQGFFNDFESAAGNRDAMKGSIDQIYTYAANGVDSGIIDMIDFNYITVQLCIIVNEYELPSQSCGTEVEIPEELTESSDSSGEKSVMRRILGILLRVVIVLVVVFGAVVVLFAIKAKKQRQQPEEE